MKSICSKTQIAGIFKVQRTRFGIRRRLLAVSLALNVSDDFGREVKLEMGDPLFDTYQAYRLSTADPAHTPNRSGCGGAGCGCSALALLMLATAAAALLF